MHTISVVLVDDNPSFLRVLTSFLPAESQGEFQVVAAVADGRQAVPCVTATLPDVVCLDLNMPEVPGLVLLPQLRAQVPQAVIVVVTMHEDEHLRQATLALGADAFVSKATIASSLLPTLRRLVAARNDTASARSAEPADSAAAPVPPRPLGTS